MKKILSHLLVSTVLLAAVLNVSGLPQTNRALAQATDTQFDQKIADQIRQAGGTSEDVQTAGVAPDTGGLSFISRGILSAVGWLSIGLFKLITLFTWIAGNILNLIVKYSVLDMRNNIAGDSNTGAKILETWGIIRDLSNLAFIFVLLFAAIKTILGTGSNQKRLIVGVIVAAVLMNFSLFFTKFVIDVANIIAIFFYSLVAPGALKDPINSGIANALMSVLNPQSIMDANQIGTLDGGKILTVGLAGSLLVALAAAILFMVAMMFIVRFVVLILVLILSPFAFMANAAPGLEKYWTQWKNALLGQAFFAPLYFLLTWITIKVSQGLLLDNKGSLAGALLGVVDESNPTATKIVAAPGAVTLIVNYLIVAAFLFATLALSKKVADSSGDFSSKATKWVTGLAGNTTFNAMGSIARNTVGRGAQMAAESDLIRSRMATSRVARLAETGLSKVGSSSLDFRNTALGSAASNLVGGGKGSNKNYAQIRQARVSAREEQAKRLDKKMTTGDVERELNARKWSSAEDLEFLRKQKLSDTQIAAINSRGSTDETLHSIGLSATQVNNIKQQAQQDVAAQIRNVNNDRKAKFIESLSQTRWYNPNLYTSSSEDREAAMNLRKRAPKTQAQEMAEELKKAGVGNNSSNTNASPTAETSSPKASEVINPTVDSTERPVAPVEPIISEVRNTSSVAMPTSSEIKESGMNISTSRIVGVAEKKTYIPNNIIRSNRTSVDDVTGSAEHQQMRDTYYDVLGVKSTDSDKEISEAFRKLSSMNHPDRYVSGSPEIKKLAEDRMKNISEAYSVLRNDRSAYNERLKREGKL